MVHVLWILLSIACAANHHIAPVHSLEMVTQIASNFATINNIHIGNIYNFPYRDFRGFLQDIYTQ